MVNAEGAQVVSRNLLICGTITNAPHRRPCTGSSISLKPSHPPPKSQPPSTPHDAIAKEAPATHPIAHLLTLGGGHMSDPLQYFNLQSGH